MTRSASKPRGRLLRSPPPALAAAKPQTVTAVTPKPCWRSATFGWSLVSGICVWAAFPPLGLWPLAWIATLGWIRVIRMPQLDARRAWGCLLLTSYGHWLLMTQWVRLPHFSAGIGWFFLAAYLSLYLVGFLAVARWLVHRAGFSSVLAVPLVWVAMELARSYLFTGFALALLSHSQIRFTPILQMASVTGAYGVSFLLLLFAAAVEITLWPDQPRQATARRRLWPLAVAGFAIGCSLAFGMLRMTRSVPPRDSLRVALVQGDLDTEFDVGTGPSERAFDAYIRMTLQATSAEEIDLVIWPESMFQYGIIDLHAERSDAPATEVARWRRAAELSRSRAESLVRAFNAHCLLGTDTLQWQQGSLRRFNTAAFYDEHGQLQGSYHKMHPVMFGEYIPLGNVFPWLYEWTPMRGVGGLSRGDRPHSFAVQEVSFVPNICFENTVPQLIRHQVRTLETTGADADVLVTLTNDGWFWGSSLLDLHLACGVMRAVENHRPMLIAANTGFSAHIDRWGRVLQQGPRRAKQVLVVDVNGSESPLSFYTRNGDGFGMLCCLVVGLGLAMSYRRRAIR